MDVTIIQRLSRVGLTAQSLAGGTYGFVREATRMGHVHEWVMFSTDPKHDDAQLPESWSEPVVLTHTVDGEYVEEDERNFDTLNDFLTHWCASVLNSGNA